MSIDFKLYVKFKFKFGFKNLPNKFYATRCDGRIILE